MAVTSDQNLLFYHLGESIVRTRQIAGYNEEVMDVCFVGQGAQQLAVVSNSEQLRVYNLETNNCEILYGHAEIILTCASSCDGKLMVTGSKDNTAILWSVDTTELPGQQFVQSFSCTGHTGPVSAVSFATQSTLFFLSASHDRTVKYWDLKGESPKAKYTFQAHEKDIQALDVAPNDKLFATAGLDKTAKLWSVLDGSLLGTFTGHKRGIWAVKFSPVDQVLATCSTDKTIKLWSLNDFSCIKTFEGHLNTVLDVTFMTAGMQLLSCGSDGLLKVWNIKENECIATFDDHDDRVWAIALDAGETRIASGSSDSTITIWKDTTLENQDQIDSERQALIVKYSFFNCRNQDLDLFLARKDFKSALILAMQLDQPFKMLSILKSVNTDDAKQQVESLIAHLDASDVHLTNPSLKSFFCLCATGTHFQKTHSFAKR